MGKFELSFCKILVDYALHTTHADDVHQYMHSFNYKTLYSIPFHPLNGLFKVYIFPYIGVPQIVKRMKKD